VSGVPHFSIPPRIAQGYLGIAKNLDIEGLGANKLAISGNQSSRVFDIGGGATVTLEDLTITDGFVDHGGGILNEASSTLTVSHVTLSNNQAADGLGGGAVFNDVGASLCISHSSLTNNQATTAVNFDPTTGGGGGGAIFNNFGASLCVTDSDLENNQAVTTVGFDNFGGAIYNLGGTATVTDCTLGDNQVSGGGSSTIVGGGARGAVENGVNATLTVTESRFTNNQTVSAAGDGYFALGGALDNELDSIATISNCQFTGNRAVSGATGTGAANEADGGAIMNDIGGDGKATLLVDQTIFTGNEAIGGEGGGLGEGGGIANGAIATVTRSTFTGNRAIGGDDSAVDVNLTFNPGAGLGGGIANFDTLTVAASTFTKNQALGGNGGSAGCGASVYALEPGGGGIDNEGTANISDSTFEKNEAVGGSNSTGGTVGGGFIGNAPGGGLVNFGVATVTNCRFDHNQAIGGSGNTGANGVIRNGVGSGGGIANTATFLANSLIASNVTLSDNQAVGGTGDTGGVLAGVGVGGGLANFAGATGTLSNSTIDHNQAIGGQGAAGANSSDGWGGGIGNILGSTLTVSNCLLHHDRAVGGDGLGGGNGGNGLGGAIYNDGSTAFGVSSLTVTTSHITQNRADGGEGATAASLARVSAAAFTWPMAASFVSTRQPSSRRTMPLPATTTSSETSRPAEAGQAFRSDWVRFPDRSRTKDESTAAAEARPPPRGTCTGPALGDEVSAPNLQSVQDCPGC